MAKDTQKVVQELHDALEMAVNDLASDGDYVVNRWCVVVDSTRMDSGRRTHNTLYDPNEAGWDIKGLLYEAIDSVGEIAFQTDDEDYEDYDSE